MDTLQKTVLITHTLIAILIIVLVLLQRGKGADAGAAFGAGASGTVFGARGSSSFFSCKAHTPVPRGDAPSSKHSKHSRTRPEAAPSATS